MKEYLLLFRGGDGAAAQQSPGKWQAHMQNWMVWMEGLKEQGKLIGAQPLNPGGKVIMGVNKLISDGAYMDGKEIVGGYLTCMASGMDEAVAISKGCPILEFENGMVEVRESKELKM